jgi:hypothetical protein
MRPDAMPVASEEIAPTHVEHGAHSSPSGSPHQRCTKYPAVVREPGGPGCGVSGGPVPGIGPSSAAKILDQVEAEPHATEVLYDIRVPKVAAQDWPAFAKLVEQMRQGKTTWPGELELVQEWYAPHLDRIHNDAPFRAADVAQLGQIAAGYGSRERPLSPRHTTIPLLSLPLSLAPLNVLAATLSILESVICVAETDGACLFCLRSLATAEVETAPTSTAKTHNANFFIYLSFNATEFPRTIIPPHRYPNRCPVLKKIQSCFRDTPKRRSMWTVIFLTILGPGSVRQRRLPPQNTQTDVVRGCRAEPPI